MAYFGPAGLSLHPLLSGLLGLNPTDKELSVMEGKIRHVRSPEAQKREGRRTDVAK